VTGDAVNPDKWLWVVIGWTVADGVAWDPDTSRETEVKAGVSPLNTVSPAGVAAGRLDAVARGDRSSVLAFLVGLPADAFGVVLSGPPSSLSERASSCAPRFSFAVWPTSFDRYPVTPGVPGRVPRRKGLLSESKVCGALSNVVTCIKSLLRSSCSENEGSVAYPIGLKADILQECMNPNS
jgi:hypothetical protein